MKTKLLDKKGMPYRKNMQTIYFDYNTERKGNPNFYPTVIDCCASTLTAKVIEYTKKGGDTNNLTPNDIFKKN